MRKLNLINFISILVSHGVLSLLHKQTAIFLYMKKRKKRESIRKRKRKRRKSLEEKKKKEKRIKATK